MENVGLLPWEDSFWSAVWRYCFQDSTAKVGIVSYHLFISALSFGKSTLVKSFPSNLGMSLGIVYVRNKWNVQGSCVFAILFWKLYIYSWVWSIMQLIYCRWVSTRSNCPDAYYQYQSKCVNTVVNYRPWGFSLDPSKLHHSIFGKTSLHSRPDILYTSSFLIW